MESITNPHFDADGPIADVIEATTLKHIQALIKELGVKATPKQVREIAAELATGLIEDLEWE